MDTLPRDYFIGSSWELNRIRRVWRSYPGQRTAAHHLLYLALQGKDWRKAFAPLTSLRKRTNGGYHTWSYRTTVRDFKNYKRQLEMAERLRRVPNAAWTTYRLEELDRLEAKLLGPFINLVKPQQVIELAKLLPNLSNWGGQFPGMNYDPNVFPAYTLPDEAS